MKISLAICTWNRSRLLKQTLDSIVAMDKPSEIDWELVVVDNRSTDDTLKVIQAYQSSLPIKYVFEAQQGHSASRNAAIREMTGDYVLWTDNDVEVDSDWLNAYAQGFAEHPRAAFFGGRITPVFEAGIPKWIDATWEKCKPVFAARDLGNSQVPLGNGVYPYGANFAIRADVQQEFQYDSQLGRKASGMLGEDEISVLRKIDQAGHTGVWLPRASLKHIIPADRATTQYIANYFTGQGQTNILQGKVQKTVEVAKQEFLKNRLAWRIKRWIREPDEWVSHLIRANLSRGEYQALKQKQELI